MEAGEIKQLVTSSEGTFKMRHAYMQITNGCQRIFQSVIHFSTKRNSLPEEKSRLDNSQCSPNPSVRSPAWSSALVSLFGGAACPSITFASIKPASFVPTFSAQRHFSVGPVSRSAGETDSKLVAKLKAEITYEEDAGSKMTPNGSKNSRPTAHSNIRIAFSCSESDTNEMDEELEVEPEEDGKDAIEDCRIRTAISIMKPGHGGMVIDSSTDGSTFDIDNVSFYDDEKLALDESYENDWKRRGLYFGPTFIDLDEELQQSFNDFLEERAIGSELAAIVLDLAEHKEQKNTLTGSRK
ncbi:hypothetical protein H4Q26_015562 [Puccinia striiformis f. sp. tritici PST-130]|nr:hypothetical protein H4Q26_015562 [Puccinia striiformis f. sp. tritici PST-130]